MGLDIYGFATKNKKWKKIKYMNTKVYNELTEPENPEDLSSVRNYKEEFEPDFKEIWYARKVRWIHNWFEAIYEELEPEDKEPFNCVKVQVTDEILDKLQEDYDSGSLVENYSQGGFFFGDYDFHEDDYAKDAVESFIEKCREAIKDGLIIYYDSWW